MYRFPDPKTCADVPQFFRRFYDENQPHLSHRKFAAEMSWPVSLLGDLIQGRKQLTLSRGVEFSRKCGLSNLQCEYLLMLSLKTVGHQGVQDYAEEYLRTEGRAVSDNTTSDEKTHHMVDESLLSEIDAMVLLAFLEWSRGSEIPPSASN